jgi:predicted TIM-barrel fold metal-dependent hydrolase
MVDTGAQIDVTLIPIVDAHHHFWDLTHSYYPWLCDNEMIPFRYGDYTAIRRDYLPADYRRDCVKYRVIKTVHMEAEWDRRDPAAETRWLETVNAQSGLPNACVGHAEPDNPNIEKILTAHSKSALVHGIRHKPKAALNPGDATRGAPGSMDDPRWRAGYGLLERFAFSYDLQTPWWHLDAAAALAADFPHTQIIINHTGLPSDRTDDGLQAWRAALEHVAQQSNVAIKISGIGHPNLPWTLEANSPIIRDTISIFGVDRCMFASNFPVDSLTGSFDTIYDGFFASVADRSFADHRKLFCDNAIRIYRLGQ